MIAIYNGTSEFGGIDVVVSRFVAYLENIGRAYCIIDRKNSWLKSTYTNYVFYTEDNSHLFNEKISHVLIPSVTALFNRDVPNLEPNARALIWNLHPNDAFSGLFPFSGIGLKFAGYRSVNMLKWIFKTYASKFTEFCQELIDRRGLIAMDGPTKRALKYFVGTSDAAIPIVPISASASIIPGLSHRGTLSIGYLGRMDIMKWSAFRGLLDFSLAPLAKKRAVELHIISEGPFLKAIEDRCQRYGIKLTQYGYLPNEDARRMICGKTDIGVAMGTSALDLAGAGHPCVIIDPALSLRTASQRLFRFVHETHDCSVGEFRDFPGYVPGLRSFADCCEPTLLAEAAKAGPVYVACHHDPDTVFAALLQAIERSELRFGNVITEARGLHEQFWAVKQSPLGAMRRSAR